MPTAHDRIQVTRDERVQRILEVGSARFPGRPPGRVLVDLAAERVAELEGDRNPLDLLPPIVFTGSTVLTTDMVDELLDDE